jgi:DNA-binding protein HU-beta
MNKSDLIAAMAGRAEVSIRMRRLPRRLPGRRIRLLGCRRGEAFHYGWLSFEQVTRIARMGRNPQTGEALHVPATKACKVSVAPS